MPNPRRATLNDVAAIAQISQLSNDHAWTQNQFVQSVQSPHNFVYLIENENEIMAFIVWQTVLDETELHLIATHPNFRRLGYAEKLLQIMLLHAQETQIARLFLEVNCHNLAAQKLYEKHGFKTISQRKNYYGENQHALIMEKIC